MIARLDALNWSPSRSAWDQRVRASPPFPQAWYVVRFLRFPEVPSGFPEVPWASLGFPGSPPSIVGAFCHLERRSTAPT